MNFGFWIFGAKMMQKIYTYLLLYFLPQCRVQNLVLPTPKRPQNQLVPNSKLGLTRLRHQKLLCYQVVEMRRTWLKSKPRKSSPSWVRPWLCFLFWCVEKARKLLTAERVSSTRCLCKWCSQLRSAWRPGNPNLTYFLATLGKAWLLRNLKRNSQKLYCVGKSPNLFHFNLDKR